jgi:hypothetical protein
MGKWLTKQQEGNLAENWRDLLLAKIKEKNRTNNQKGMLFSQCKPLFSKNDKNILNQKNLLFFLFPSPVALLALFIIIHQICLRRKEILPKRGF